MKARRLSILMLLVTVVSCGPIDDSPIKQAAKAQVQILNDANIRGDYEKVVDLSHPGLIDLFGGRKELIAFLDRSMKDAKEQGIELKSAKVGEPSEVVRKANELYVVVPVEMTMKRPGETVITKSFVIGVSTDKGETWTFVNSNSIETIKKVLPNLPEALKLPAPIPPVIRKE